MEALRKVVNGDEIPSSFGIPDSFKKRKLEVIIIPFEEEIEKKVDLKRPGALQAYKRPEMIEFEKTAWEMAMREKHENS